MNHVLCGSSSFDSCRKKRGIFPDTVYDPVEAKGGRPYAGSSPCCVSGTCRGCTPCWYTMGRCAIRHRSHSVGSAGAGGASFRGDHAGLGENRSLSGGAGKLEWLADLPHPSCGAESRPADLPARRGRGPVGGSPLPGADAGEVLLHQERQTALQAALGQLSAGERLLFYRKYYYLPSTAQIALELGLTERTVEGRLYRLKRQLRKLPGGDERS